MNPFVNWFEFAPSKIGDPRTGGKGPPGRDHWIHSLPALLAGGGIAGGQVYGSSDAVAAYPADRPCSPEDLAATVYHAMGITPEDLMWTDRGDKREETKGVRGGDKRCQEPFI